GVSLRARHCWIVRISCVISAHDSPDFFSVTLRRGGVAAGAPPPARTGPRTGERNTTRPHRAAFGGFDFFGLEFLFCTPLWCGVAWRAVSPFGVSPFAFRSGWMLSYAPRQSPRCRASQWARSTSRALGSPGSSDCPTAPEHPIEQSNRRTGPI